MKIVSPHRWDVSPSQAKEIQQGLRRRVSTERAFRQVNTVAGVDVSIKGEVARAAIVVLSYPELTPVGYSLAELRAEFPYVPGLLAFRCVIELYSAVLAGGNTGPARDALALINIADSAGGCH